MKPAPEPQPSEALRFIIALGLLSLFADMVYEGAHCPGAFSRDPWRERGRHRRHLRVGEFVGYALRVVAGYAADRSHRYWALTIGGYVLTLVAVPLLGLVGRVDLAFALVTAERLGKAIRTPARDALVSHATHRTGRGIGFGLHEALDQIGAVVSPLLLGLLLALRKGNYGLAFGVLAIPGVFALCALIWARVKVPDPSKFEPDYVEARQEAGEPRQALPPTLRRYLAFVLAATIGFAPFPLISFHLTTQKVVTEAQIPLLFARPWRSMRSSRSGGRLYDRRGLAVLASVPLLTVASLALFSESGPLAWMGAAVWGGILGLQESTLRAAVGDLVKTRRAAAYGIFNAFYGLALLARFSGSSMNGRCSCWLPMSWPRS